jgi:DNA-binding LytR/AlgR family response regulator
MLRAIAIDDEPLALQVIEQLCLGHTEINLLKTFTKASEGLKYSNEYPVDLIFLDIQMPSMLGTELATLTRKDILIIFTTAYDQFALEGFNLNAIDFLLKPIARNRFSQSIDKARKYLMGIRNVEQNDENFITLRADYSLVRVDVNKITHIEGLDDYIKIHLRDSKPLVTRLTMKVILELLPENKFVRVHRSFIVPKKDITSLKNRTIFLNTIQVPVGNSFEQNLEGLF